MIYPSEETLKKIAEYSFTEFTPDNFHEFMKLVESEWEFADWGWEVEGNVYHISTGGWSGNEDLIGAMKENIMFWLMYWQQSRRGGHYIFCPIGAEID